MKTFLFIVEGWFLLHWSYVAIMAAKRETLTLYWKVMLGPLAIIGLLLDAVFNATAGTLMFVELPRELLFTSRCNRHWDKSTGFRHRMASFWRKQLNLFDEGHVG